MQLSVHALKSSDRYMVVVVLVAQLCPTVCDPMDYSPPGSSVHGILQTRILEWVAIPSSRGSSWPRDRIWVSSMHADSLPSEPWGKTQRLYCGHLKAQPQHPLEFYSTFILLNKIDSVLIVLNKSDQGGRKGKSCLLCNLPGWGCWIVVQIPAGVLQN